MLLLLLENVHIKARTELTYTDICTLTCICTMCACASECSVPKSIYNNIIWYLYIIYIIIYIFMCVCVWQAFITVFGSSSPQQPPEISNRSPPWDLLSFPTRRTERTAASVEMAAEAPLESESCLPAAMPWDAMDAGENHSQFEGHESW